MFERLTDKLSSALKSLRFRGKISEEDVKSAIREIKLALLEADVNYGIVRDFVGRIQALVINQEVMKSLTPLQHIIKIVREELVTLLGSQSEQIKFSSMDPSIILLCGLQGSGKTTHAAKLAFFLKNKCKKNPVLVACDIYRPAAIEQLKSLGSKALVPVFEQGKVSPIQIAQNSVQYAKNNNHDVIILDTAGRLHVDKELMEELRGIKVGVAVSETLLVVDSMAGQSIVAVASAFDDMVSVDGIILSKIDSDARGGAAISVRAAIQKPIKFMGTGERLADLDVFHPDRIASRILGMGDTLSLIEEAEAAFDAEQQRKIEKSLQENNFSFDDLLANMQAIKKLGSLKNIVSMIPGVGGKITEEQFEKSEKELIKTKAIISSMTLQERQNPDIIKASRKKRIADGSGHKVEDVNRLFKQFEMMRQAMKQFSSYRKKQKSNEK
ncbi:MAG: signal recognition particle protein [Oscillospiraceae bacterium]|jgi:signal recognition particle subunit SRP54|nr:signal recognition particle protein [Oscillospiraceae bacterium]